MGQNTLLTMTDSKYQIGDKLPNTRFEICGVMTTSEGTTRYWLRVLDNTVVVSEDDLELLIALAN